MKLIAVMFCFLFLSSFSIIGNKKRQDTIPKVQVIIILGQSNASGRAEVRRLRNASYNYKSISTGYPTARVAQAQYDSLPSGIFIYGKPAKTAADSLIIDNATWAAYQAGVQGNSNFDLAAVPNYKNFGPELSLAQKIRDQTGDEVFIIKCGIGGTGLTFGTSSTTPGTWNNTIRNIATEFFIKRAIRDLITYRPNKHINLAGVVWWQGEQDAGNAVGSVTYSTEFYDLKAVIDRSIRDNFSLKHAYYWNIVKIKYLATAAEDTINVALANIISARSDCRLINIDAYPRKTSLSSGEASPVTVASPVNSARGDDNSHTSYIGQLSAGELIYENIKVHF